MFHQKDSSLITSRISWAPDFSLSTICPGIHGQSLELTVVFTTVQDTLAAVKEAGRLAHQLGAQIRILVPQVVPYALPIEHPPVDPLFKVRKFHTLCGTEEVDTRIEVRLCRDAQRCVGEALGLESIILIGGRRRFWSTRPLRLAEKLCRMGHHVIFVTCK